MSLSWVGLLPVVIKALDDAIAYRADDCGNREDCGTGMCGDHPDFRRAEEYREARLLLTSAPSPAAKAGAAA